MTYKEPDYETVIVQKLRAMEDLLKSFMASLEGPPLKKGRRVPVYPEFGGTIQSWEKGTGETVRETEPICMIRYEIDDPFDQNPDKFSYVLAPEDGTLFVLVTEGWVSATTKIAEIEP